MAGIGDSPEPREGGFRPYGWMLLAAFIFSIMGALTHALGETVPWHFIALVRTSTALVLTVGAGLLAGVRFAIWRPGSLWLRSLAGCVSLVLTFYSLTRLPIADTLTLTNIFPVWVVLLSWPMTGQRPANGIWLAVASGVIGVGLIQRPHLATGNIAALAAFASSISTAFAMMGLHLLKGVDVRAIVAHFSGVSTIACLAIFLSAGEKLPSHAIGDPTTIAMLLGVGATATLGQLSMTRAFTAGSPPAVAVVGLTQVVYALGFDMFLWGRRVDPLTFLGMLLVLSPTAWLLARGPAEEPILE